MRTQTFFRHYFLLAGLVACSTSSDTVRSADRSPVDLEAAAQRLFTDYEAAIKSGPREAIARAYHVDGAVRVINGTTSRMSRAELDNIYRTVWTPPAFFTFDSLAYDAIDDRTVLVTGGFRWLRPGSTDTASYLYAAVLQASDSGVGIRFEHETTRPRR